MHCVLAAEGAILVHFDLVGGILLVLERIVVPLLALIASECDLYSHFRHLLVVLGSKPCVASLYDENGENFCAQK